MPLASYLWIHVQFLFVATSILLVSSAGPLYLLFWVWPRSAWTRWRLTPRQSLPQPKREAWLTFLNLMVYMYPFLIAAGVEYTTGYTVRYSAINEHGWTYFFVSIFVFLLVVDADFYWTHRFLHRKFRSCHAVHHQFVDPTPWCGFAFHFGESFLLAFPYVPLLLLLPWHPAAVLAVQTVAMTWNAYLHLGYDPIPESFKQRRPLRWILTARDHCGHHQHPQSNFGLYFSYWDNLCGTRFKKDSL